jgi:L-threonylcarbamoyladenylate synthase
MNINEEVHKAYEVIKKAESSCIPQIPSGDVMRQILSCCQNIQTQTKSRKPKYVLMNGERMMYNVFKDIPEVAWQIMDLSENRPLSS